MFSGLIENVGTLEQGEDVAQGRRLHVRTGLGPELAPGDSVAVNGVCLTVVTCDDAGFQSEISPETARVTTLGGLGSGTQVNLERPLRADMRFGGHFVLGHVDGVGSLVEVCQQAECWLLTLTYDPSLEPYLVHKGSVALDGISLTVAALHRGRFDVQIVPYTWEHTNLQSAPVPTAVNLECDIIGKYVVKAVGESASMGTKETG